VIQSKYHKTSGLPALCDPAMVCRCDLFTSTGVADSYLGKADSNSPILYDIYDPPDASDASDASNANITNPMDTHAANGDSLSVDVDTADATDADAFQVLSQGDRDLTTTNACKIAVDRPPDVLEGLTEPSIEFDSSFSDTSSVVVDVFPFGNPGAPIPGVPRGCTSYEQFQATLGNSNWAPFRSQRDWDIARWAKTHSISSSAVDELLAIPEVCSTQLSPPLCP
jgi:hypothetical protein